MPSWLFVLLDRWLSPPPKPAKVAWIGEWSFAHRGLHGAGVPENSRAAFAAAMSRGLGIECDVQRASDGAAMVFHDWELDRLTAETGPVAKRGSIELEKVRLEDSAETIPTLRRVLADVKGQVPVLIEVKSSTDTRVPALCLAVRRVLEGYTGPHAVMSFDPRVSHWFYRHSPHTVRGLVVSEGEDRALAGMIRRRLSLWRAKPDFLAYDIRDLPSRFAAGQRRRGLPVATWTVRSAEHLQRAFDHADAPIAEGAGIGAGA